MGEIKRLIKRLMNSLKRATKTGTYWYWSESEVDTINISSMVYPLRYDILIRKNFFDFYIQNKNLYLDDMPEFMKQAKTILYYDWFCGIIANRSAERLNEDTSRLNRAYESRVKESINVYESIHSNGFDPDYPIVPHTGEVILPAKSGRKSVIKYHMGDGCHRLACLIALGYEELPKEFFRIKVFNTYTPLDNTFTLANKVNINDKWLNETIDSSGVDLKTIKND